MRGPANFRSTRDREHRTNISQALRRGPAPDGGLYVPEKFPSYETADFEGLEAFPDIATRMLKPFFAGDPLAPHLRSICREAFNFKIPLEFLSSDTAVLELFHGPSSAFKDVGARFLAECVSRAAPDPARPRGVIVATSGDTGGAIASAFFGRPGVEVFVLYPGGKVSARQEKQLTAWGGNVRAFRVKGDFDACQRIVKQALQDPLWARERELISANSINVARLLPQAAYYAAAGMWYFHKTGETPGFIVPSGNLGNAVGAFWAAKMGFPVGKVVLAVNANRAVSDYFRTGKWTPHPTIHTLANAMDVGNPSNMERILDLYPTLEELRGAAGCVSASDAEISEAIRQGPAQWGRVWCPHTAAAAHARNTLESGDWVIVATAHPAKFDTIVEPLVGRKVDVPASLQKILGRPSQFTEIDATLEAFTRAAAARARAGR